MSVSSLLGCLSIKFTNKEKNIKIKKKKKINKMMNGLYV
jgi:hypothetical protein